MLCRYFYYVEVGVSAQHIAPFRQAWIENVLSLLPMEQPTHLDDDYYQQLLEEAVDEMKADYVYSMRKSIMDYIIKSAVERRCVPTAATLLSYLLWNRYLSAACQGPHTHVCTEAHVVDSKDLSEVIPIGALRKLQQCQHSCCDDITDTHVHCANAWRSQKAVLVDRCHVNTSLSGAVADLPSPIC